MIIARKIKTKNGFTLVELLIVIIIIGVLASVLTLSMGSTDDTLKANEILENLRIAKEATQNYYTKNGTWPSNETYLNDDTFADIIDKKLPDEYQVMVRTNDDGGKVKKGSVFVRCRELNSLPKGVRKKLAKMSKENNLWNTSTYTNENDKYYKDTGSGANTIHLPVEIVY